MDNYCEETGKRCYSQKEAGNIIRLCHTTRRKRNYGKKVPARSYFCQFCKTYHVTHYKSRDYVNEDKQLVKGERQYDKSRRH